jgi:hypothetical protein
MRIQCLALTCLVTVVASSAVAQQAAAPPATVFMSNKDIMGLVDKAKADRKGDAAMAAEPILLLAPYRAQLEYRPGTGPAAVHEKDAELMVVLDGTGNIVTGGKLVDEKRVNANNLSGPSIANGDAHMVVKGDMILIPPQHAASGDPGRRGAHRPDDNACAISAGKLAAGELGAVKFDTRSAHVRHLAGIERSKIRATMPLGLPGIKS